MTSRHLFLATAALLTCAFAPAALAQPLSVTAQIGSTSVAVPSGGTLAMNSTGQDVIAVVTATYPTTAAQASATIQQISVSGTDFALLSAPTTQFTVNKGGSFSFSIRYLPTSGASSSGQASITLTEGASTSPTTVSFALAGTAPDFSYSVLYPDNTIVNVSPGGKITYPTTRLNTPVTLTVIAKNSGSGTGIVTGANVTGQDFRLSSSSFPATVPSGFDTRFSITFNPQTRGTSLGTLQVLTGVRSATFSLEGTVNSPDFVIAYALRSDNNTRPLNDGGKLLFAPTAALTTALADIIISNRGTGSGKVNSVNLTGSAFQLTGLPLLPATLNAGQNFQFTVQFSPKQLGTFTGTLSIDAEDKPVNATLEGSTSGPTFVLSSIDPQTTNETVVPDSGSIVFPATVVSTSTTLTLNVRNQGSGTGFLNGVTLTGEGFQLTGLPAFPASIVANQSLRFGLRFSPLKSERYTGSIKIDYSDRSITIPIEGNASGPAFSYQLIREDTSAEAIAPNSSTSINAAVGQTVRSIVRIRNDSTTDSQISVISITGTGYQVTDLPILPVTIRAGQEDSFTIVFSPTAPGTSRARLRIGNDLFDFVGTAAGSRLQFSFVNNAASTSVLEGGTVILTPTKVGENSSVDFVVQNTGTSAASISTIDLTPATVFTLENLPPLPTSLDAGASLTFRIRFLPNNVGNLAATLRVNSSSFLVSGNGQQPVPLPDFRFEGASGTQQPLQQPAIRLTLSSGYGLPLRGTLTLSFVSNVFAQNPAVQFATGGRTVNFTIPANSTQAIFENNSNDIRLQTGSLAGTINITPVFATQGGLDITPTSAPNLTLNIASSVPNLTDIRMPTRSLNAFTITVVGYSTTRSLKQLTVKFTPRGDNKFNQTDIPVNVDSVAQAFFQGVQSQNSGGLFSISIPFSLLNAPQNEDVVQRIQSVSVTATNDQGTSNSLSFNIP